MHAVKTPTRTITLRILLIFFLLIWQQMGIAHAISHLEIQHRSTSHDQQLPSEQYCNKCLTFSSIDAAVANLTIVSFAHAFGNTVAIAHDNIHFSPTTCVAFHSRAPPLAS